MLTNLQLGRALSFMRHQRGSRDSGLEKSLPKWFSLLAGKLVLPISWLGAQPGLWAGGQVPPHWASPWAPGRAAWAPSQQGWLAGSKRACPRRTRRILHIFSDLVSEVMRHHLHHHRPTWTPREGTPNLTHLPMSRGRACGTAGLRMATFEIICHGNPFLLRPSD